MANYGVEYDGFSALAMKIESLGVSMDEIANKVLDEVAPLAVSAFKPHVPYDSKEKDSVHARNNVNVSATKSGKNGRYKLVGVFTNNGASVDWSIGKYLFYVENGTSKMPAKPFMKAAEAAVKSVVEPKMKSAIEAEIKSRLEG
ncbi:MAG: HK97-gp10 family putative phage morphogenesis protein [Hominilimicola sp.]